MSSSSTTSPTSGANSSGYEQDPKHQVDTVLPAPEVRPTNSGNPTFTHNSSSSSKRSSTSGTKKKNPSVASAGASEMKHKMHRVLSEDVSPREAKDRDDTGYNSEDDTLIEDALMTSSSDDKPRFKDGEQSGAINRRCAGGAELGGIPVPCEDDNGVPRAWMFPAQQSSSDDSDGRGKRGVRPGERVHKKAPSLRSTTATVGSSSAGPSLVGNSPNRTNNDVAIAYGYGERSGPRNSNTKPQQQHPQHRQPPQPRDGHTQRQVRPSGGYPRTLSNHPPAPQMQAPYVSMPIPEWQLPLQQRVASSSSVPTAGGGGGGPASTVPFSHFSPAFSFEAAPLQQMGAGGAGGMLNSLYNMNNNTSNAINYNSAVSPPVNGAAMTNMQMLFQAMNNNNNNTNMSAVQGDFRNNNDNNGRAVFMLNGNNENLNGNNSNNNNNNNSGSNVIFLQPQEAQQLLLLQQQQQQLQQQLQQQQQVQQQEQSQQQSSLLVMQQMMQILQQMQQQQQFQQQQQPYQPQPQPAPSMQPSFLPPPPPQQAPQPPQPFIPQSYQDFMSPPNANTPPTSFSSSTIEMEKCLLPEAPWRRGPQGRVDRTSMQHKNKQQSDSRCGSAAAQATWSVSSTPAAEKAAARPVCWMGSEKSGWIPLSIEG